MPKPKLLARKADIIDMLRRHLTRTDVLFVKNIVERGLPCSIVIPEYRINFGPTGLTINVTQLVPPYAYNTYRIPLHEASRFHNWCVNPPKLTPEIQEFPVEFSIVEFMYNPDDPGQ